MSDVPEVVPPPRDISQLFFSTDPLEIRESEFELVILPYFRSQRAKFLITESTGNRAPTNKRIAAPADLKIDFKDLKF